MIRALLCGLLTFSLVSPATWGQSGGKFNKKIADGDKAPVWTGLPGVDGKKHSLADLSDKDVIVFIITCNHCPVAVHYEERIINFTKKHAGKDSKVAVVACNVNTSDDDSLPKMIEHSKAKGFNFAYIYDESQKIGRAYGATVTPEFFVLNKERKIIYMGAMDDVTNAKSAKINYVEQAVIAGLKGQMPTTTETRGRGCGVQYND